MTYQQSFLNGKTDELRQVKAQNAELGAKATQVKLQLENFSIEQQMVQDQDDSNFFNARSVLEERGQRAEEEREERMNRLNGLRGVMEDPQKAKAEEWKQFMMMVSDSRSKQQAAADFLKAPY